MKPPLYLSAGTLCTCAGLALLLASAPLVTPVRAVDPAETTAVDRSSRFSFSLLPKSLQMRPALDFHVITEVTAEGRKLAPPSAANPVYYIAQPGKFTHLGNNGFGGDKEPNLERFTQAIEAALASGNFLKASPTSPLPAIAVVFNYGTFPRFSMDFHDMKDDQALADMGFADGPMLRSENRDIRALLPVVIANKAEREDILKRAAIIGGEKFSLNLAKALNEEAVHRSGSDTLSSLGFNSSEAASPFHRFMNENENLMMLVEDSFNGCYFVIASAFDYVAMKKGQRVLLWRTKMSVNSSGINMTESLPSLVRAAGPYLGKEMPDAVTLTRRINRGGRVDFGETRVMETDVASPGSPAPDPSPAPAPSAPPEKPEKAAP